MCISGVMQKLLKNAYFLIYESILRNKRLTDKLSIENLTL
jgi:hypothetical protein